MSTTLQVATVTHDVTRRSYVFLSWPAGPERRPSVPARFGLTLDGPCRRAATPSTLS